MQRSSGSHLIDETGTSPVYQLEGGLAGGDAASGGSSFSPVLPTSLKVWVHIWKFMPLSGSEDAPHQLSRVCVLPLHPISPT